MSTLTVPPSGITLGPIPAPAGGASEGLQALMLDFVDGAILEEALKQGADLKITCGKSMKLHYGKKTIEVVPTKDTRTHELYRQDAGGFDQLEFVGMFSHILEVRGADDGGLDEAKAKLQKSYELYNDQKAASSTMVMDSSELPPAMSGRRAMYYQKKAGRQAPHSRPTTPALKSTRSPLPDSDQSSAVPQATLDALRIPLLHLLALGPASEHSLATKTRASEEIIARVLNRIARKTPGGRQWELIDDFYKELDAWEFPYIKDAHRSRAVENARAAFGRMRLGKDAPEYRMLLSPEEREKAEMAATPKPPSVRKTASEGRVSPAAKPSLTVKAEDTSKAAPATKKATAKNNISRIISGKKKAPAKPKGAIGRPPKAASTAKKAPAKSKTSTKYKSAEIIENSDIEIEDDVPLRPPPASSQAAKKPISPSQHMSMQRTVSKSSSVTASDTESGRTGAKRSALSGAASPAKRPKTSGSTPIGASSQVSQKSVTDRNTSAKSLPRKEEILATEGGRKSGKRPATSNAVSPAKRPRTSDTSSTTSSTSQGVYTHPTKSYSHQDAASVRSLSNSPPKPSPLGSSPPITASNGGISSASSPAMTPGGSSTASQSPLDSLSTRNRLTDSNPLKRKTTNVAVGTSHKQSRIDAHVLQLARDFRDEYQKYKRFHDELARGPRSRLTSDKIRRLETWSADLEAMKRKIESVAACR